MAYCITFQNVFTVASTASNAVGVAKVLPVFTATTTPQNCAIVALTGAEYNAQNIAINTTNNSLTTIVNQHTTQIAQINSQLTTTTTTATNAGIAASTAQAAANAVNSLATTANTLASQAKTIADSAMAQTNALANITTGLNTFNGVFNIPTTTALGAAWAAGFILPMTIGLISFAVAKLVNFWDE